MSFRDEVLAKLAQTEKSMEELNQKHEKTLTKFKRVSEIFLEARNIFEDPSSEDTTPTPIPTTHTPTNASPSTTPAHTKPVPPLRHIKPPPISGLSKLQSQPSSPSPSPSTPPSPPLGRSDKPDSDASNGHTEPVLIKVSGNKDHRAASPRPPSGGRSYLNKLFPSAGSSPSEDSKRKLPDSWMFDKRDHIIIQFLKAEKTYCANLNLVVEVTSYEN